MASASDDCSVRLHTLPPTPAAAAAPAAAPAAGPPRHTDYVRAVCHCPPAAAAAAAGGGGGGGGGLLSGGWDKTAVLRAL